jgi:DNA-binding response OmpR family regulator
MADEPPRCTVCGKPVFPTAPTMFRSARYTTHPRCIRVPKPEPTPRHERAAAQAAGPDAKRNLDDIAYLGTLLSGAQVLVIAQRDVVGEALQRFFRSLGANAFPAASMERAIGLVQAVRPELVVCDVSLLTFEDRALARQLRERSGESAPLVLGIGATPAERGIADAAALDAFVLKPVGYRELAEALRGAARRRADWMERQRDRLRRRRESVRAEASQHRLNAEVTRLKAQDAITKAEKLAARAKARSSPLRDRATRAARPRYRPSLLGY